jgi:uncharacterized alkaline shock family protein YloU
MSAGAVSDAPSRPEQRGVTVVADRAVSKIAGRAAGEIDHVLPPPATGFARLTGGGSDPGVSAVVHGASVQLEVQVAVAYPAPLRSVARHVRAAVRTRVEDLTGLKVRSVRVEIVAAPTARPTSVRVR